MNYEQIILDFLLSMKWLWIVVIILVYRLVKISINEVVRRTSIKSDITIRDTVYKEDDIIGHLDYIISEALDEYVLLNIKPKNVYYINTKLENKMIDYLSEEVPKRISKTLLTHLSFIYNSDYVGEFIGKHIYMVVLNYVLTYNINNSDDDTIKK